MNDTPRERLLARHAGATAELDALRRAALPAERVALRDLWRELFWVRRAAWGALAAAWLVILAVRLAQPAQPPPAPAGARADALYAWRETRRLLDHDLFAEDRPLR